MDTQLFSSVDEYLALQPDDLRKKLQVLRQTILQAVPKAEEIISYQMPAYRYKGMLAYFGVAKRHYALYVSPENLNQFRHKLSGFSLTKSAIHFPLDMPVPVDLVKEILQNAFRKNIEKEELKKTVKSKKNNN